MSDDQPTAAAKMAITIVKDETRHNRWSVYLGDIELGRMLRMSDAEGMRLDTARAIDEAAGLYQLEVALAHIDRLCRIELHDDPKEMRRAMTEAKIHAQEALARLRGEEGVSDE